MTLSVLIPIYNEKNTILEILKRIDAVDLSEISFKKEIVLVDDGSSDGTRQILKGLEDKYKIIYHPKNQGKGAAIKTGLNHVFGDYVIIQDADLEYDPKDYIKLLKVALKNKAEVVYGSRRLNPKNKYSHLSFYLGGIMLNWLASILYGIKITDESTCYKLFKTETIKSIPLGCKRFEFCPEITAKIAKRKIKIYEVPIEYYPRDKKEGKKIKWRDGFEALWVLIKYKFTD
ncbi:MAG: glycosyltransferase family 2 protein [Candidatus Nealsonbacteria bacterium]|nr:glycosyltransferase family 2 protein [Candidatus Nealsonbacteria bacterium]